MTFTAEELQNSIDVLYNYCVRWKLQLNMEKINNDFFRKGGRIPRNLRFVFDKVLGIVR